LTIMRSLLFACALFIAFGAVAPTSAAADPILIALQSANDPTLLLLSGLGFLGLAAGLRRRTRRQARS
jgi:hypothetical protein